ncbi:MAG: DUF5597 domain-containing protein [Bacteroidota bacterium]
MLKTFKITLLCFLFIVLVFKIAQAQSVQNPIPQIIKKDGRYAFMVDGKPFFMLGGQVHNSSGWPGMMPQVWAAAKQMHLNTIEIPIYWEQIEPQQGKFDFSMIDLLLKQARSHQVRLVLLWFATWKNGSNHYMPEWMKREAAKYPNITGLHNKPIDSPSPHIQATMDADVAAFRQVMKHLKVADPQHTIIMMQVENESGTWDSMRDYSPLAQKLFEGPVPAEVLKPELLKDLHAEDPSGGSWQKVFGDRADEYFHAWSVASFIGKVAAAGKKEYNLPMYTNAALRDPLTNPKANTYESGGPTDNVISLWKVAAPALDLVAPDIYLPENEKILKVLELYNRPDNPLFVPEADFNSTNAKYLYEVIARGGIGFSPFGIDDNNRGTPVTDFNQRLEPFGNEYSIVATIPQLTQWAIEGKTSATIEPEDHKEQTIDLGAWQAVVSFAGARNAIAAANDRALGRVMLVKLSADKFIAIGSHCHITFKPLGDNAGRAWQYLKVEEGSYQNGVFKPLRILNGDETDWGGPSFGNKPTILQISLVKR